MWVLCNNLTKQSRDIDSHSPTIAKVLKTGIEVSCNGILGSDGMIHYDPMDFSPSWLQYMRKNVALAKHLEMPVSGH